MSSIPITDALLRNLASRRCRDEALMRAYETGQALTRPARSPLQSVIGRIASTFIQSGPKDTPRRTDPDASRARRRKWARDSSMPDGLRAHYTEGEAAALAVIANEVRKHGECSLPIDAIGAIAGVSRTTVQNAIRKARSPERGHIAVELRPQVGRKNLPNIVRIISAYWMTWLKRSIGFKPMRPSEREENKSSLSTPNAPTKWAFEREKAAALPTHTRTACAEPIRPPRSTIFDASSAPSWRLRAT